MPWIGITSLRTASLTMLPRMTLTTSISPSDAIRRRIVSPVGVSMPSSIRSSTAMRIETTKSGPTRRRTACNTASGKRIRFSNDPP